jgi:hypothetical protein
MSTNFKATFTENFTKVVAFFFSVVVLLDAMTQVSPASVNADPFGFVTFILVAVFMFLWSITGWDIIETEVQP